MKNTFRRAAVLLLTLVLLLNCTPVALADAPEETSGEVAAAPEVTAEPAPEVTAEPAPEVTAEPAPETTAEPAPEVTAEPAPEVTAEPAPEVTVEPAPEVTAEPAPEVTAEPAPETTAEPAPETTAEPTPEATAEPDASPEPSASPEPGADLAAVQAMVDALPDTDTLLAMDESGQDAVYAQLQAAYDAFIALPEDLQAQLTGAQERFEALFGIFNAMISMIAASGVYEYYDPSDGQMHDIPGNPYIADLLNEAKDMPLMCGHWFVVRNDLNVTPKDDRDVARPLQVSGSGDVNILLMDGVTLTINGSIKFNSSSQRLVIWGGQNQTGKLVVEGGYNTAIDGSDSYGALTVNGGVVDVSTRTSRMITVPSVTVNAGDVYFNYGNGSSNGPIVAGSLTIAPEAYVGGGGVEKNTPVNAGGQRVFSITQTQMQQITKSWHGRYTLDGKQYTYRAGSHDDSALWLTAGEHTLEMENGEKIVLTIAEDGAISWSSDYTEQTSYFDPFQDAMLGTNARPVTDSTDTLCDAWYVVKGAVTHDGAPPCISKAT